MSKCMPAEQKEGETALGRTFVTSKKKGGKITIGSLSKEALLLPAWKKGLSYLLGQTSEGGGDGAQPRADLPVQSLALSHSVRP